MATRSSTTILFHSIKNTCNNNSYYSNTIPGTTFTAPSFPYTATVITADTLTVAVIAHCPVNANVSVTAIVTATVQSHCWN
jgi:hypothetical protein